jgi:general nucleoside transport system permease protein
MSVTTTPPGTPPTPAPGPSAPAPEERRRFGARGALVALGIAIVGLSLARVISGQDVLTSTGTSAAVLSLSLPIAMAGLGGLVAERAGVVNIGLEGMMILGTWGAGWAGYQWGPWAALVGAVVGGMLGGLLHAVATVTFGVDHIVSGVAINLLAVGLVRFLSEISFVGVRGGGPTQSPTISGGVPSFDVPVLASGPDLLGELEESRIVVIADVAGVLRGILTGVTPFAVIGILLLPAVWFLLWRTALGLRWRSAGENPYAAESLGVNVYRVKYLAVVTSGALAGLGGLFIVLFSGLYKEGQTGGRGFIGLAAMIFGNWRPSGLAGGALLFGYSDAVRLREQGSGGVLALFLFAAFVVLVVGAWQLSRRRFVAGGVLTGLGLLLLTPYLTVDRLPNEVTTVTPYIVTLLVLAISAQNLRMPTYDGVQYRRGEDH